MRMLFGCKVPEAARVLEVKANPGGAGRPRTIFRGPLDEAGSYTLTEDAVIDAVSADSRFWDWVTAQKRSGRLASPSGVGDAGFVALRLSVCFLNQDGSLAVIDEGTGSTSYSCPDMWEFHKSVNAQKDTDPMVLIIELTKALIEQQKLMPEVMVKMLKEISENGRVTIQTSATESSKILTAMIEPYKSQLAMIDRHSSGETVRANKATDACIRQLNASTEQKSWTGSPDDWIGAAKGLVQVAQGLGQLSRKG